MTTQKTSELLTSAGYRVRPFRHPDTFLTYVRDHQPAAAIVDWGGSHAQGLKVRTRLGEVSPMTSVIVSLKIHQSQARTVLEGDELVEMIKQICAGKSRRDLAEPGVFYP